MQKQSQKKSPAVRNSPYHDFKNVTDEELAEIIKEAEEEMDKVELPCFEYDRKVNGELGGVKMNIDAKLKIYISGKITGDCDFKEKFAKAEKFLKEKGFTPLNPAKLPEGLDYQDYMKIDLALIDIADGIYFLSDYKTSKGALFEKSYAEIFNKKFFYEEESSTKEFIEKYIPAETRYFEKNGLSFYAKCGSLTVLKNGKEIFRAMDVFAEKIPEDEEIVSFYNLLKEMKQKYSESKIEVKNAE